MRRFLWVLLASGLSLSCGGATTLNIGKDTYRIECGDSINRCMSQADNLCRDRGFTILRGKSWKKRLGTEDYGSMAADTEVVVQCGIHEQPAEQTTASAADAHQEDASKRHAEELLGTACVPGATQKCVGPGACDGGQVCLESGHGFGACDCGGPLPSASQPTAAAPAPTATATGTAVTP